MVIRTRTEPAKTWNEPELKFRNIWMGLKSLTLETRNPNRPEPNPIRYRYIVSYNIMVPIFLKNISPLLYFFNIMLSIFQTNFFFKTTIYVSKQTSFFKLQSMFPNNFFLKLQFMFPNKHFFKNAIHVSKQT